MKEEEFLKRLSEVAEWEYPTVSDSGYVPNPTSKYQKTKLARQLKDMLDSNDIGQAEYDELSQQLDEGANGPNKSTGPRVIKIKHEPQQCGDCGLMVEGRVVARKVYWTNRPHWRRNCVTCKKYENPYTGVIEMTGVQSQSAWARYTNNRGIYKSKYQPDVLGDKTDCDK